MRPKDLKFPFTWQDRKPALFKGVLIVPQHYYAHDEWGFPGWETYFQVPNHPICIEFCSGNGDWVIERAQQYPKQNWIAVEKRFDRVQKIWSKMHNLGVMNLLIVCGSAESFVDAYLPNTSIDEVYVNFPDPWPKDKHAKNRLLKEPFVRHLKRILKKEGRAIFVTDDAPYRDQMIDEMREWKSQFPNKYTTEWTNYGGSWFEELWRNKGRDIYYMQFAAN